MTTAPPLIFEWNGEAFVPANPFHARQCNKHFVVHERYALVEHHERSDISHRHYFASVREAWMNLPEHLAPQFATYEHLRKFALCMTGFHDQTAYPCKSVAEAVRTMAIIDALDTFCVVRRDGMTVIRLTAKSQSMRAMGKDVFQDSKTKVLDYISDMIGTSRPALEEHARAA